MAYSVPVTLYVLTNRKVVVSSRRMAGDQNETWVALTSLWRVVTDEMLIRKKKKSINGFLVDFEIVDVKGDVGEKDTNSLALGRWLCAWMKQPIGTGFLVQAARCNYCWLQGHFSGPCSIRICSCETRDPHYRPRVKVQGLSEHCSHSSAVRNLASEQLQRSFLPPTAPNTIHS